jgi:hypothetical protein
MMWNSACLVIFFTNDEEIYEMNKYKCLIYLSRNVEVNINRVEYDWLDRFGRPEGGYVEWEDSTR